MNNAILQVRIIEPPASSLQQGPGSATTEAMMTAYVPPTGERDQGGQITCKAFGKLADSLLQQTAPTWLALKGRLELPDSGIPTLVLDAAWPSLDLGSDPTAVSEAINSLALVGRAGKDPEIRFFESGGCVANLSLAVNRRRRDDPPDWFSLAIWGNQAQVAADYVRKGALLGISGKLKFDHWTDRASGEERSRPVVMVDRLDLLGGKRDQEGGGQPRAPQRPSAPAPTTNGGMW
jgi:single-strand DNA-binding protein